jgi:hypothetical protein
MTLPDMAPSDENPIRTFLKGLKDEMRGNTAAAHHANGKDLGLVF